MTTTESIKSQWEIRNASKQPTREAIEILRTVPEQNRRMVMEEAQRIASKHGFRNVRVVDMQAALVSARTRRMQEIEGLMNAHRQNWTSIDRAVLAELKNEWWHLKEAQKSEEAAQ